MKIAAYCRVSTDKEEQRESLLHQKEFFLEYARRCGHELVGLYADEGISGTSLKKREAFRGLMRDAERGKFELVVVKDVSRFARNTVDALQSVRWLKSLGINTLFINAGMTALGDGEFALTLFSAMAQEESSNLSKRVKWGKRINAEKGRVPPRVFGYDKIDNFTLAVNEEEARVVRKIFGRYVDGGLGCRSISLELNREGEKTKFGGEWNARGVRRILVNPLYSGLLINHKYEVEDFLTGKQVALPEQEQFCHRRPEWAIISPEVFQRAQAVLASRRRQYDSGEPFREGRYSGRHPFSTLIKCAHCGRSFTRKSYTDDEKRADRRHFRYHIACKHVACGKCNERYCALVNEKRGGREENACAHCGSVDYGAYEVEHGFCKKSGIISRKARFDSARDRHCADAEKQKALHESRAEGRFAIGIFREFFLYLFAEAVYLSIEVEKRSHYSAQHH